jgi:hypothetical protein
MPEQPTPSPAKVPGRPVVPPTRAPEQPVVPPDDPVAPYVDREPSIDPPPTDPPMRLPSEKPGITEPPSPRAAPSTIARSRPTGRSG